MKRILVLAGFIAALALPALAQSYQCVGGELLGGPEGYSCETNASGEITSVQPAAASTRTVTTTRPVTTRPMTTTRTVTRSAPTTTTIRRHTHTAPRPTTTHRPASTHNHGPITHTHMHTHSDGTRHSHAHSHGSTSTHVTTTHRPVTTVRPTPMPIRPSAPRPAPIPADCDAAYTKLPDTRDGRRQFEVCYADLKPITSATADSLYARINSAAWRACRGHGLSFYNTSRSCQRAAVLDAVRDVNLPALDSYYARKTGKRVPRVTVGPLRR
jgi:UrcA family protein